LGQKFFQTLVKGKWKPEALEVEITKPGETLGRSVLADAWMEGAWQEFIRVGNKPWPGDLEPKRYRLDSIAKEGDKVKLKADPCVSYHDFIGTQMPAFKEKFGERFVSNAIATTVIILTSDNKTLMTERVKPTDYKHKGWHGSIGGFWEIPKNETPTQAVLRELEEEAGIKPEETEELWLLGAVHNPWTAHPDLIYSAKTKLTSAEILSRKHDDENALFFIDTSAASYEYWIRNSSHASVVVPLAAMQWVGEELFGADWAKMIEGVLEAESAGYDNIVERQKLQKRDIARFADMLTKHRAQPAVAA
jgi:8-oxo-dGTP pyrophosphatase MutT (NUDIX family)